MNFSWMFWLFKELNILYADNKTEWDYIALYTAWTTLTWPCRSCTTSTAVLSPTLVCCDTLPGPKRVSSSQPFFSSEYTYDAPVPLQPQPISPANMRMRRGQWLLRWGWDAWQCWTNLPTWGRRLSGLWRSSGTIQLNSTISFPSRRVLRVWTSRSSHRSRSVITILHICRDIYIASFMHVDDSLDWSPKYESFLTCCMHIYVKWLLLWRGFLMNFSWCYLTGSCFRLHSIIAAILGGFMDFRAKSWGAVMIQRCHNTTRTHRCITSMMFLKLRSCCLPQHNSLIHAAHIVWSVWGLPHACMSTFYLRTWGNVCLWRYLKPKKEVWSSWTADRLLILQCSPCSGWPPKFPGNGCCSSH